MEESCPLNVNKIKSSKRSSALTEAKGKVKPDFILFLMIVIISDFLKTILKFFPLPNFVSLGSYFKPSYSEILHLHVKPVRFEYESTRTVLCVQSLSVIKQKH